jgi:hypothetical protein
LLCVDSIDIVQPSYFCDNMYGNIVNDEIPVPDIRHDSVEARWIMLSASRTDAGYDSAVSLTLVNI